MQLSKDLSPNVTDESINTATHMAGAIFAIFGSGVLIAVSAINHKWWHLGAFIVYGISLVNLFVMSSLHHGINGSEKTNRHLRTMDYLAIYGLIVGTITPVCLILFKSVVGYVALATVALAGAFGITMRAIYHDLPGYVSQTLYVCMGWLPIFLPMLTGITIPTGGLLLLVGGGLFYTIGAVIFGMEKPNLIPGKFGFHEIWHIAVILGALCHYIFLYKYVLPL
jgi:hemolysin III